MTPVPFLISISKAWQPQFFYLSVPQWASHVPHSVAVKWASKSPFKLKQHNWPRFQSVHHLPRLGSSPVIFSVCTRPSTEEGIQHKEAVQERLLLSSTWNSSSTLFCSFQLVNFYFLEENIFDRVTELSHQLSGLGTLGDEPGKPGLGWKTHLNSVPSWKPNAMVALLVKAREHSPSVYNMLTFKLWSHPEICFLPCFLPYGLMRYHKPSPVMPCVWG